MFSRRTLWITTAGAAAFAAIQFIPYPQAERNPPARSEPAWDSARTRELAVRACFDCHSNETRWPWYSAVAPVSWLVHRDVIQGREELNLSEWPAAAEHADDAAEEVREDEMPPWFYRPLHAGARLTAAERELLAAGLERTLSQRRASR